MASEARSARELADRLLAHARTDKRASARGAAGAAATALHRISVVLCRSLGAGGCHALLTQALRRARADHPALAGLGIVGGSQPRLDRLTESVEAHGVKETAAGLEAALVALFELLNRLIGADLSTKLAELSMTNDLSDAAKPDDEGAP